MTQKIGINLFCDSIYDMEPEEMAPFVVARGLSPIRGRVVIERAEP